MLAIDADSHFVELLDLYEKYIDPQFRDRAFKVQTNPATACAKSWSTTKRYSCSTLRSC
jgi:hypothetical protein